MYVNKNRTENRKKSYFLMTMYEAKYSKHAKRVKSDEGRKRMDSLNTI
jgi:hypothetical protein